MSSKTGGGSLLCKAVRAALAHLGRHDRRGKEAALLVQRRVEARRFRRDEILGRPAAIGEPLQNARFLLLRGARHGLWKHSGVSRGAAR
jgi:hypothetical protein